MCRTIVPSTKSAENRSLYWWSGAELDIDKKTLHAGGEGNCSSQDMVVSVFKRRFRLFFLDAGFEIFSLVFVLWTQHSTPSKDLCVVVLQY